MKSKLIPMTSYNRAHPSDPFIQTYTGGHAMYLLYGGKNCPLSHEIIPIAGIPFSRVVFSTPYHTLLLVDNKIAYATKCGIISVLTGVRMRGYKVNILELVKRFGHDNEDMADANKIARTLKFIDPKLTAVFVGIEKKSGKPFLHTGTIKDASTEHTENTVYFYHTGNVDCGHWELALYQPDRILPKVPKISPFEYPGADYPTMRPSTLPKKHISSEKKDLTSFPTSFTTPFPTKNVDTFLLRPYYDVTQTFQQTNFLKGKEKKEKDERVERERERNERLEKERDRRERLEKERDRHERLEKERERNERVEREKKMRTEKERKERVERENRERAEINRAIIASRETARKEDNKRNEELSLAEAYKLEREVQLAIKKIKEENDRLTHLYGDQREIYDHIKREREREL